MDITLERILSLIPKNKDGYFKHGELLKFAQSIGLKSGNVVSDWINGRSKSYMKYLYQISSLYGVSIEWLKGETDIKNPSDGEGKITVDEFKELVKDVPTEELSKFLLYLSQELDKRDLK